MSYSTADTDTLIDRQIQLADQLLHDADSPALRLLAGQWLNTVRPLLPHNHRLIDPYDILYRIVHQAPDPRLLDIRLQTLQRHLQGDPAISQTDIAQLLTPYIALLPTPQALYIAGITEQWVNQLTQHGRFLDADPAETSRRLNILLPQDLYAFIGSRQAQIKRRWRQALTPSNP